MIYFDSSAIYIDSATSIADKITRIDAVISALLTSALKAAETGSVSEYSLDDGQTKIQSKYRNPAEVMKSIEAFTALKQIYVNMLNGRMVRLVDSSNFTRNKYGR